METRPPAPSISQTEDLIIAWREGDLTARDKLIVRLLPELKQIAAARLRRQHNSSLSTHELINEAVTRLLKAENMQLADRAHFVALSSRLMRNVLIDHVRAANAGRRKGERVELNTRIEGEVQFDLYQLDSALIRLEAIEPAFAEIVEMRYFGGMSIGDIAHVMRCSEPTVKRRWQVARAWLADALANPVTGV